jgi:anti-sigma regulatory factor (Ser/Thr protein kinase)
MVDSLQYTPQITLEFPIGEEDFFMAGEYASRVKKTLQQLGLDQKIIRRIAIIIYEAAMNVAIHAHHGILTVHIDTKGIFIKTDDKGAGIPDIELAMQEGYSTASDEIREMGFGAGMGLSNMKKNSDKLLINSEINKGTEVEMTTYVKSKL